MPLNPALPTHVTDFTTDTFRTFPTRHSAARHAKRALVVVLAALLGAVTAFAMPARANTSTVARIAGDDRVDTAVTASQATFSSTDHVVLTRAGDYPDALAATAFAADRSAPILLTARGELESSVAEEIRRLGADTVTILGGESAVSAAVESAVAGLAPNVTRVAGDSRYDTAGQLATAVGPGSGGRVALALGTDSSGTPGWADALSAGSLAAAPEPIPTLLTASDELPAATVAAITELQPNEVLLVGGENAITPAVERAVADLGPQTRRLAGSNRYQTSVAVAKEAFAAGVPRDDLVFVSGQNFPDALGAAAFAAHQISPMLLVPSTRLADSVDGFIRDNNGAFDDGLLVGGTSAVDDFVEAEITAALQGTTRPTPPPPPAPEPEPEPVKPSHNGYTFRFDLEIWDRLAACESGQNWSINTGNGYYGGIQFSLASWRAVGGSGYPHHASRLEQIYRGELLQARQGWGAWPACTRKLGIR